MASLPSSPSQSLEKCEAIFISCEVQQSLYDYPLDTIPLLLLWKDTAYLFNASQIERQYCDMQQNLQANPLGAQNTSGCGLRGLGY